MMMHKLQDQKMPHAHGRSSYNFEEVDNDGDDDDEPSPISTRWPIISTHIHSDPSAAAPAVSRGGNRWPRQETLALLKIRSEMDIAFRDAPIKAPLWDHVSRRLAELGYKRSAKKCREKFENVQKYYKRTKEARDGRLDGKSYKFFSQLEALNSNVVGSNSNTSAFSSATNTTYKPSVATSEANSLFLPSSGIGVTNIMPVSSTGIPQSQIEAPPGIGVLPLEFDAVEPQPDVLLSTLATAPTFSSSALEDVFSSESASSSSFSLAIDKKEERDMIEIEGGLEVGEIASITEHQRKRKRASSENQLSKRGRTSKGRMMDFFEDLMKQVIQKQESMQQRFLDAIDKRERDRLVRQEAWKRQEAARLEREHGLVSQEHAISASRDSAIIAYLQKITGQTIQIPPAVNVRPLTPPPIAVPAYQPSTSPSQPPPSLQQIQTPQPQQEYMPQQPHHARQEQQISSHRQQCPEVDEVTIEKKNQLSNSMSKSLMFASVPEQKVPLVQETINPLGDGSSEGTSSRWPKTEVLALIQLRSGMESRYLETGPKGPLWEEISAGMLRLGYKRYPKRCKEKWENINKYFKKVRESNGKRADDAKTCPYFDELDALYRKKILCTSSISVDQTSPHEGRQEHQLQEIIQEVDNVPMEISPKVRHYAELEDKNGSSAEVKNSGAGSAASFFGRGRDTTGGGSQT